MAGIRQRPRFPQPTPPPPPTFTSPLGHLSNRAAGFFPPTNVSEYGVIVAYGNAPSGFRGDQLLYRSSVSCRNNNNNVTETECLANGWELRTSGGTALTNVGYGGVIADPGNAAYRQRWCELSIAAVNAIGAEGVWCDDSVPRISQLSGGVYPAQYPTNEAYATALLGFYQFVHSYMNARGKKDGYNCLIASDNDGSATNAWFTSVGQAGAANYLTPEYWLTPAATDNVRTTGSAWYQNWDQWRLPHQTCVQYGMGFLPLSTVQAQAYSLGTFMLDWDGVRGANMWDPDETYVSTIDPWSTAYAQARSLGIPVSPATNIGTVWTRQYTNGTVQVNSSTATATFNVGGGGGH